MTEKPIQQLYIDILNSLGAPYIHINSKGGKYQKKDFPDLLFFYKGIHLREYGVKGRHSKRKERQLEFMRRCKESSNSKDVSYKLIFTENAAKEDLKEMGIIL